MYRDDTVKMQKRKVPGKNAGKRPRRYLTFRGAYYKLVKVPAAAGAHHMGS